MVTVLLCLLCCVHQLLSELPNHNGSFRVADVVHSVFFLSTNLGSYVQITFLISRKASSENPVQNTTVSEIQSQSWKGQVLQFYS